MRKPLAAALLLTALTLAGCGSSEHAASPSSVAATTRATTGSKPKPKEKARPRSTTRPADTAAGTTTVPAPATTTSTRTTTTVAAAPTEPAGTVPTATAAVVQQSVCPSEQRPGIAVNFGFRPSRADALLLAEHAGRYGFQNLQVQQRTCSRYAVVLTGLQSLRQAKALRTEARTVGLRVLLECRSHAIQGGLAAVFGHRKTRRAAILLKKRAEAVGFRNLQVQQDRCGDWEVDLYGLLTPGQRAQLRREAARVGFHIRFEPG